jgi:hypothetical protein
LEVSLHVHLHVRGIPECVIDQQALITRRQT